MTTAEWKACSDPVAMLDAISDREAGGEILRFACVCCRRIWDHMTDRRIRAVVEVAERWSQGTMGADELNEALQDAADALEEATVKFQKTNNQQKIAELSRVIGAAEAVLFFEYQDILDTAMDLSKHIIERADDPEAEKIAQAELLKEIILDPIALPLEDNDGDE